MNDSVEMSESEMFPRYSIDDLKQTGAYEFRAVPTGTYVIARNGKKKMETVGKEYVPTRVGKIERREWCRLMEEAIREEDKNTLLFQIETHARLHCAWLHSEGAVHEYAMSCLSSGAYKQWEDFKEGGESVENTLYQDPEEIRG